MVSRQRWKPRKKEIEVGPGNLAKELHYEPQGIGEKKRGRKKIKETAEVEP